MLKKLFELEELWRIQIVFGFLKNYIIEFWTVRMFNFQVESFNVVIVLQLLTQGLLKEFFSLAKRSFSKGEAYKILLE